MIKKELKELYKKYFFTQNVLIGMGAIFAGQFVLQITQNRPWDYVEFYAYIAIEFITKWIIPYIIPTLIIMGCIKALSSLANIEKQLEQINNKLEEDDYEEY